MPEWMSKTLGIGINMKKAQDDAKRAAEEAGEEFVEADLAAPVNGYYVVAGHCPRAGIVNFKLTGKANFRTSSK